MRGMGGGLPNASIRLSAAYCRLCTSRFTEYESAISSLLLHAVWSAIGMILSSVCQSVRLSLTLWIVAKRYILQQECLNKWIGSGLPGTRLYNFQPPIPTAQTSHPQNFKSYMSGIATVACRRWLFQTTVCSYTIWRRMHTVVLLVVHYAQRDAHADHVILFICYF